jgi:hypothetical protein
MGVRFTILRGKLGCMRPKRSRVLELHVRLEPVLAARLRSFAWRSERTLAGCVRLLVKDGLDRADDGDEPEASAD